MNEKNKIAALLILGMACLLIGLGQMFIDYSWSITAAWLSLVGLVACLISFGVLRLSIHKAVRALQWQKLGFILLVVIVFGALYLSINYVAHLYPFRVDMTRYKQHTLSSQTIAMIGITMKT